MPDKGQFRTRCGSECVRCWRNKLKHANKLKKKQFPKQNMWYMDNIEPDTNPVNEYTSHLEEFHDKYITSNNTHAQKNKISKISKDIHYIYYNEGMDRETYNSYNRWLFSEKKMKNKLTCSKFIKLFHKTTQMPETYKNYYMYECNYE